eukprot:Lankesteria_metandrocarpae@DN5243_c0_g1_i4.p1
MASISAEIYQRRGSTTRSFPYRQDCCHFLCQPRVKRVSFLSWWSEALDESLTYNSTLNSRASVEDTDLKPLGSTGNVTLFPVECAIGHYDTMTLIGILDCDKKEDYDCASEYSAAGGGSAKENKIEMDGATVWRLHDLSQRIPLKLTNMTQFSADYFCDGLVVLATGKMDAVRKEFEVQSLYLPPREIGDDSIYPLTMVHPRKLPVDPTPNVTGSTLLWDNAQPLLSADVPPGRTVFFFSEVHLDVPAVRQTLQRELTVIDAAIGRSYNAPAATFITRHRHSATLTQSSSTFTHDALFDVNLRTPVAYTGTATAGNNTNSIFDGSEDFITSSYIGLHESSPVQLPVALVFLGNFHSKCSVNFNFSIGREYAANFGQLAIMLADVPNVLRHCHIIIVPGPGDPGPAIFPKPPLLPVFTNNITAALQNVEPKAKVTLASNPCHVQCQSQRLVIARQNLLSALQNGKTSLHIPTNEKYNPTKQELSLMIPRLLLSQGHLAPFGRSALTRVATDFDFALRLDPLPDLVCIADRCSAYSSTLPECPNTLVFNPGNFGVEAGIYDMTSRAVTVMETK